MSQRRRKLLDSNGASIELRQRAKLRGVCLVGEDLDGVNLREGDLRGADLHGSTLRGADLQRADLRGADLAGCDFRRADLSWANLTGANLQGARLLECHTREMRLSGANLHMAWWGPYEKGKLAPRGWVGVGDGRLMACWAKMKGWLEDAGADIAIAQVLHREHPELELNELVRLSRATGRVEP